MIRLKTFGTVGLQRDGEPLTGGAAQRRPLALLALLAAAGTGGVSRDKLIGYLWSERDEERARHVLAQTLYALRRELGGVEAVLGSSELRLNRQVIGSDVADLDEALSADAPDRIAALYSGPFLDGFYLSDASEFERWVERERARWAGRVRAAFERAARASALHGDSHRAVEWWRRVAAMDPFDARVAVALMESLDAIGDRAGALRHARVYETLAREELGAPPDPAVSSLCERLRARTAAPASTKPDSATAKPSSQTSSGEHIPRSSARQWPPRAARLAFSATLIVAVAAFGVRSILADHGAASRRGVVLAIGAVRDYSGADTSGIARALTDMLATNLSRLPDVRVVSNARIYELVGRWQRGQEGAAQLTGAAREAGATEILEGAMYRRSTGGLRFDLRRVDLATGTIRKGYSIEATDPFDLVDRATAEVGADLNPGATTALHVADVTTRSFVGYRFYEEGLRATYQLYDVQAAHRFFLAALAEDSTFAMAAYYAALSELTLGTPNVLARFAHAARLADHATERERLLIRGMMAFQANEPSRLAMAESLATRYPMEPDGHYLLGQALTWDGQFLAAVPHLRRVIEMDSSSLRGTTARCRACDAFETMLTAYWLADSLGAAERVAREWTRLQPGAPEPWRSLANVLSYQGRYDEARMAFQAAMDHSSGRIDPTLFEAYLAMRTDLARADSLLAHMSGEPSAPWLRTIVLRYRGRLREALDLARQMRFRQPGGARQSHPAPPEAIVLYDMGRYAEAAAAFAAVAATPMLGPPFRSHDARDRAWNLTHEATARAAAGDTATLAKLVDSVERVGAVSAYGRDRRLHHYIRGLLFRARGQLPAAADELARGIFSSTDGYTRNNYELARTLLLLHRPTDAIAALQPTFRGSLQASNSYVTHTELHEALAQAFDMAEQADSAAAHYRYVIRAWAAADPPFRARWKRARSRLLALGYKPVP